MQLETYIKDLLYRYECVIIPGFGAFLTQSTSAHIDTTNHTFYPPAKTLSFNRQLQTNDGLLANYVASVENCSYETALQKIRNFAGKLLGRLSEKETVTLKNIGDFFLSKENTIQFAPSVKENFNTDSFGLTAFTSLQIFREVTINASKETVVLHQEKKRTVYPFMRYAAIGLIAITLGGASGFKIYENQVEKHNFAEKQKADLLVETQIQEATFVIENPLPALHITVPKQAGKYHIVAGAFRIEENSTKKVEQLQKLGYNARKIGKNKYGLHQVVYSSYQDRLEAIKMLRTIQRTENKDAWLLVQNLSE